MPKNTTQCPQPGLEHRPAHSGDERTNHEGTAPPDGSSLCDLQFIQYLLPNVACLFVVLAGVVPSLDTNNDEVVDVLYRVQAMRLADAPRPRNTTPGAGYSPKLEM